MKIVLGNIEKRDVWGQWILRPIDTFVPLIEGTDLFDLDKAPKEARDELAKINRARKIVSLLESGRLGEKITDVREWDSYGPAYKVRAPRRAHVTLDDRVNVAIEAVKCQCTVAVHPWVHGEFYELLTPPVELPNELLLPDAPCARPRNSYEIFLIGGGEDEKG